MPPFRAFLDITSIDDLLYLNRKVPRDDVDLDGKKCFIEFLKGLLKIDPVERWNSSQAILHPFLQGGRADSFAPVPSKF